MTIQTLIRKRVTSITKILIGKIHEIFTSSIKIIDIPSNDVFMSRNLYNVPLKEYQEVLAYPRILSQLVRTDNVRRSFRLWSPPCLLDLVIPSLHTGCNHSNSAFVGPLFEYKGLAISPAEF